MKERRRDAGVKETERHVPRRRTNTRERLLVAARDLMSARARETFTIDDVVQGANVARGSFYNHFADRDALVSEVYRVIHAREEGDVAAVNEGVADPVVRIAHGITIYARLALASPEDARILVHSRFSVMLEAALAGNLATDLRQGLRDGRLAIPSVEAGAMLVVGQVAVMMTRLQSLELVSARLLAQQTLTVTLAGLGLEHREAQVIAAQAIETGMELPSSRKSIGGVGRSR